MKLAVTLLAFSVAALLALGMVMLYSSSMTQVGAHYLIKQVIWGALGLVFCVAAAATDYRLLKKAAWPLFGLRRAPAGVRANSAYSEKPKSASRPTARGAGSASGR